MMLLPDGVVTSQDLIRHYREVRLRLRSTKPPQPKAATRKTYFVYRPLPPSKPYVPDGRPTEEKIRSCIHRSRELVSQHPGLSRMWLVVRAVAEIYGLPTRKLTFGGRPKYLCEPRHIAFTLGRDLFGLTWHQCGLGCGGADHTTAMNGWRHYHETVQAILSREER